MVRHRHVAYDCPLLGFVRDLAARIAEEDSPEEDSPVVGNPEEDIPAGSDEVPGLGDCTDEEATAVRMVRKAEAVPAEVLHDGHRPPELAQKPESAKKPE